MKKHTYNILAFAVALAAANFARADVSVAWVAPPDGSVFVVGTSVTPTGQASAVGGTGGTGLDLALVIDDSFSMRQTSAGKSKIQWTKEASIALLNALPEATTSVTLIAFEASANVYRQLTPLLPTSNKTELVNAINALTAPGGSTGIGLGINAAAAELTGPRHTAGRLQQMVVLSDGFNNTGPNPVTAAANAMTAGVDAIHTVGVPGHDATLMANIAAGRGVYTSVTDLSTLEDLFSGTGGTLVGIERVEVTMPDGTMQVVSTDGLGNFAAPAAWAIQQGPQTWVATAWDTEGNSASASLTLFGERDQNGVPDAGGSLLLLGLGLLGLSRFARSSNH